MTIFGITGQTGAGKTTVLKTLETLDGELIDCDQVYRDLLVTESALQEELVAIFGDVRNETGGIDRPKLGAMVFSEPSLLLRLNQVTQPYVLHKVEEKIAEAGRKQKNLVAIDGITLIESGLGQRCDFVFAVVADEKRRLSRILLRDGITEEYAIKRVQAQQSQEFFQENANAVIKNDFDHIDDFIQYVKDFFIKYM